ncbi:MAG: hypothetical protein P8X42_03015 [Calditrichaceae bacterium]
MLTWIIDNKRYYLIFLLMVLPISCSPNYLLNKNGKPVTVYIKIDKNYEGLGESHKINRDFLAGFMADDLKEKFRNENILSKSLPDTSKPEVSSSSKYLLKITIDRYKAKRSTHGMGPGILYLIYSFNRGDISFIKDKNINVSSIMGGTFCAKRLNETIVSDVAEIVYNREPYN